MNDSSTTATPFNEGERRSPIKLGVLLAIASEFMLFAGLVSSLVVFRGDRPDWPPLGQPRLPVETTAFNTLLLIISAFTTWAAVNKVRKGLSGTRLLGISALLGAAFLVLQGREWVALLAQGMGIEANPYGGFFYAIVGMHAAHVLAAVIICTKVYLRSSAGRYTPKRMDGLVAFSYFWFFVVALWPPLYSLVYLW